MTMKGSLFFVTLLCSCICSVLCALACLQAAGFCVQEMRWLPVYEKKNDCGKICQ